MTRLQIIFALNAIVLGVASGGCSPRQEIATPPPLVELALPKLDPVPKYFENCAQIWDWYNRKSASHSYETQKYQNWLSSQPRRYAYASDPVPATSTNTQEIDIDEPDLLKMDENFYYVARAESVEIVRKSNIRLFKSLPFPNASKLQLFLSDHHLIVIESSNLPQWSPFRSPISPIHQKTKLSLFDTRANFELIFERELYGTYKTARFSDNTLLLVLSTYSFWEESIWKGLFNEENHFLSAPCTRTLQPAFDDFDTGITMIHKLNPETPNEMHSTVVLRSADDIYVSKENLYLSSWSTQWFHWDYRERQTNFSILTKLSWKSSKEFEAQGMGQVTGHIRNSWAMKELEDDLYVATSFTEGEISGNRLWKLRVNGGALRTQGASDIFGSNEDIQAVRFERDKAYIVTFRRTDPVFIIQLDPKKDPQLLGHVEVPGFSNYLHPLPDSRLFGVGFDASAQRLQLSLFDMSDPLTPVPLEQKNFGSLQSVSETIKDHHAFFFDEVRDLLGVPVRIANESNRSSFSGALIFKSRTGLGPVARLSHREWVPSDCRFQRIGVYGFTKDIHRLAIDGDRLMTLSPFGIKIHQPSGKFQVERGLRFENPESECAKLLTRYE